jgi:wobble nucleotide-excising tRNase
MIRKILKLQNVGLLQDATQAGATELSQVTGIYADNGRGKSTFAALMRACQLGDAGRVNARKTIDSLNPPEVDLLLPTGNHVEFKANAWTGARPEIVVFDSEFVEQNVYSGFEVRADQRQSLLEFALGEQTVQLKQRVDQLTQDIDAQTRRRTQAANRLSGYATPYTVPQFITLQPVPNAQQQIEALQKRIDAAKSSEQLTVRQDPAELQGIQCDLSAVFDLLQSQLADVEETAEAVVKAHLAKHNAPAFEDWLSKGQGFLKGDDCPFCGQQLSGLVLVQAYRSHFNVAYSDLKRDVASLESKVAGQLSDARLEAAIAAAATNAARIEAWKDHIEVVMVQRECLFCG